MVHSKGLPGCVRLLLISPTPVRTRKFFPEATWQHRSPMQPNYYSSQTSTTPQTQQAPRYVATQIAELDDMLSMLPRATRGAYVDALLLQQRTSAPVHAVALNLGLSLNAQTSYRDFSKRNLSTVHSLHGDSSGMRHGGLDSSFGDTAQRRLSVTRENGDAMLRKQREVERKALRQVGGTSNATVSWEKLTAPLSSRRAY